MTVLFNSKKYRIADLATLAKLRLLAAKMGLEVIVYPNDNKWVIEAYLCLCIKQGGLYVMLILSSDSDSKL